MKCVIAIDGKEHPLRVSESGGSAHATIPCPKCNAADFPVGGSGQTPHDRFSDPADPRDYYRAQGACLVCGAFVGEIRAFVNSIFGLEEDERVLNGRPRVY